MRYLATIALAVCYAAAQQQTRGDTWISAVEPLENHPPEVTCCLAHPPQSVQKINLIIAQVTFVKCGDETLPEQGSINVKNVAKADTKILICNSPGESMQGCDTCYQDLKVGTDALVKVYGGGSKYLIFAFKGAMAGETQELYPVVPAKRPPTWPNQWTLSDPTTPLLHVGDGSLSLSFKDCGDTSTHAKVTDVTPHSLELGADTTVTGSGTLDEDISDGSYTMHMTGIGGTTLLKCSGDASVSAKCNIGLGPITIGHVSFEGVKFPINKGNITGVPKVDISMPATLPKWAASTTTTLTVDTKSGDKVICVQIMTAEASFANVF